MAEIEVSPVDSDEFLMLRTPDLELLARILRDREESMISGNMSFATEKDRVDYLTSVNEAYSLVTDLLKDAHDVMQRNARRLPRLQEPRRSRVSTIMEDTHVYIHFALNLSLQGFRNCALRHTFLSNLRKHFNALAEELEKQEVAVGEEGVLKLIEEAKAAREAMLFYANRFRSAGARSWDAAIQTYRSIIKQKGETMADIVKSHQNKLGLEGEFESLEETEQLQVYNSVIEEALGESYGFFDKFVLVAGPAVFLTTAGIMVYDIIAGGDHTEALLRDGLDLVNMVAGFGVQVAVEVGVTEIMTALGVGATLIVSLAAFVIGAGAGFFFCWGLGDWIDQLIRGGGAKAPDLKGITFHKIPAPPDGREIANEIARARGY